jgi:hypothetical protein
MVRAVLNRLLPQGPLDLLRQLSLFCGAYWLYRLVRADVYGQPGVAFAHAADVVRLERSLHVFVERPIQAWSLRTEALNDAASWMYINAHFVVTAVTLAFVYLRRNEHFYFVRNMFMVAMGLALLGYVVFPTAPPRMLPQLGFQDSVAHYTHVTDDSSVNALYNPYAAVPSMHVGFALMLSVSMVRMVRHGWQRGLWMLYAPMLTFVVIATANHFIFDAVTGALVAGVSAVAAVLFARARPNAWAWAPERELAAPARAG